MFPLWDDVPAQRVPVVNYAIIAFCVLAFLMQLGAPDDDESIVREFGMIPVRLTHPEEKRALLQGRDSEGHLVREEISLESPVSPWLTLLTSMFLHGGLMHLVGNMWFLFIFGDNVEDRFGHINYLVMYLLAGIAAGVMHVVSAPVSVVPTVGASGAIAGVMGAYLLLYPHARVMSLIPLGVFTRIVPVPAVFFLGFWFLIQVISGFADNGGQGGGVAWWAHVGGFATGLGATFLLRNAGWLTPPPQPKLVYGFPQYREERRPWE
jgi:rhomboid family protein